MITQQRLAAAAGFYLLLSMVPVGQGRSSANPTVSVSISTNKASRIEPGFAGFNVALMASAMQYRDPQLASFAARLSPGWLRFPAGTRSNAYDWKTGQSHQQWVDQFSGHRFLPTIVDALRGLAAKGGEKIEDASSLANAVGARGLIVCVNVFTDTPESAGEFAAYAKRAGIKVLVWQLGNEPTLFPQFFKDASDYANKVRPFANAIKAADPQALTSLSLKLVGEQSDEWDRTLSKFEPRYWDVLTYHEYPPADGTGAELIAALNREVVSNSTGYIEKHIRPLFGEMPVIITEANPGRAAAGRVNMAGTLYGGIWAAEFALRLSTLPQVKHFGMHQLVGLAGIDVKDAHHEELMKAYEAQQIVDSKSLDYGFFISAQGAAYAAAASAMNSASSVYPTAVNGGATAPLPNNESTQAVYAQAYQTGARLCLVVTNKGEQAEVLSVVLDGKALKSTAETITVTGPAPSARNTVDRAEVMTTSARAVGPVTVPPYSVVRVSW